MSKTAQDIILRPIITEETMGNTALKKYTFAVAKDANKIEIKKACEELFGVEVFKVNTMNSMPQNRLWKRRSRRPLKPRKRRRVPHPRRIPPEKGRVPVGIQR